MIFFSDFLSNTIEKGISRQQFWATGRFQQYLSGFLRRPEESFSNNDVNVCEIALISMVYVLISFKFFFFTFNQDFHNTLDVNSQLLQGRRYSHLSRTGSLIQSTFLAFLLTAACPHEFCDSLKTLTGHITSDCLFISASHGVQQKCPFKCQKASYLVYVSNVTHCLSYFIKRKINILVAIIV